MSRLKFWGASPRIMGKLMKKRNVATLAELVEAAKALHVGFYACEMSMNILGLGKEDFDGYVSDVIGVSRFLELSEGGETLFI